MKRITILLAVLILQIPACALPFGTGQSEADGNGSPKDQPPAQQETTAEDAVPQSGYRYVSFSGTISTALNTASMGDFTGTAFEYSGDYSVELWFPLEGGEAVQRRNTMVLTEFKDLYFGDQSCTPCEWVLDDSTFEPIPFTLDAALNLNAIGEGDQPADELAYQLAEMPQAVITGIVSCPCPGSAPGGFTDPAAFPQMLGWFMQKLVNPIHLNVLEINSVENFAVSPMGFLNISEETLSYIFVPDLETPSGPGTP